MKNGLRMLALVCTALCLAIGFTASSAQAHDDMMVSTAQMRLANLGYYVGRYDGVMGPVTAKAIKEFQSTHGLPMTGRLTIETYNRLLTSTYAAFKPTNFYDHLAYVDYHAVNPVAIEPVVSSVPVAWDMRWHYVHSQNVPSRFAAIEINEDDRGSMRHYEITINGQAVLFLSNQPNLLRLSRTFVMNDEDAVILTAYRGDPMCSYKNYLLSVRADGTFAGPQEIGNCASSYEAHVADNALFVSFPDRWMGDDVWRYENASLMRL